MYNFLNAGTATQLESIKTKYSYYKLNCDNILEQFTDCQNDIRDDTLLVQTPNNYVIVYTASTDSAYVYYMEEFLKFKFIAKFNGDKSTDTRYFSTFNFEGKLHIYLGGSEYVYDETTNTFKYSYGAVISRSGKDYEIKKEYENEIYFLTILGQSPSYLWDKKTDTIIKLNNDMSQYDSVVQTKKCIFFNDDYSGKGPIFFDCTNYSQGSINGYAKQNIGAGINYYNNEFYIWDVQNSVNKCFFLNGAINSTEEFETLRIEISPKNDAIKQAVEKYMVSNYKEYCYTTDSFLHLLKNKYLIMSVWDGAIYNKKEK